MPLEEARAKAEEWGVQYVETSAKTRANVDKVGPAPPCWSWGAGGGHLAGVLASHKRHGEGAASTDPALAASAAGASGALHFALAGGLDRFVLFASLPTGRAKGSSLYNFVSASRDLSPLLHPQRSFSFKSLK